MFRNLLICLMIIFVSSKCIVREDYKETKYGSEQGCVRQEWQNKDLCNKYPNNIYCKWLENE